MQDTAIIRNSQIRKANPTVKAEEEPNTAEFLHFARFRPWRDRSYQKMEAKKSLI
jgi:hypothetical protein